MAVWKPDLDLNNAQPGWKSPGAGADLDHLVELLQKDRDNEDLRERLGWSMHEAGVSRHRGWVAENRIVDAKTVPGREADATAWLKARGLRVPSGRSAPKVLSREIQRHVVAHGNDWPPRDVFKWNVVWTARPSRGDDSV